MTWALLALIVGLSASFAASITFLLQSRDDRVAAAKLASQLESACAKRDEVTLRLGRLASDAEDTRIRLESVIAQRDARISQLEKMEEEWSREVDPSVLGARLRDTGVLGGSGEGTVAADRPAAAASLPPSVAAVLDTARGGHGGQ